MSQNSATKLALVVVLTTLAVSWHTAQAYIPQSCTTFAGVDGDLVLVGNNEDHGNPIINIWFLPATVEAYGRFLIGTEGIVQGGMNEHGLVYDSLTIPPVDVAGDGRPLYIGFWPLHALETCTTVEDVLAFYNAHDFPGTWDGKAFFCDASGDAALFEGSGIVRKSGDYLVSTNFLQSSTPPDEITCKRFLTATAMLESAEAFAVELFRDVLDAVHVEHRGGSGTIYSTIYDLRALTITCYLYHDFLHPIVLDLREKLAHGEQAIRLFELFPINPAYEAWRDKEIEIFARTVSSFRTPDADPATYRELAGHYALPVEDLFSSPPLNLDAFTVERVGDRLCLVACPEGISLELVPFGEDRFRTATMNTLNSIDVTFQRNTSGDVEGAMLELQLPDGRTVYSTARKVSAHPQFSPLPEFMAPLLSFAADRSDSSTGLHFPLAFWIGAGLVVIGLLGIVVLLIDP